MPDEIPNPDAEYLKNQVLDMIDLDQLRNVPPIYLEGWIDGVMFACDVVIKVAQMKSEMAALATMRIEGKPN